MSDTVQQIKDRLSIVDVVSGYVKLDRAGSTMRARCPFHAEKTPSFFVSPERGTYHCFGCGVGGDIFSFIEAIEGLDFKGALKVLAERAGVELVFERGGREKKDERDRLFELMEAATIFYSSRLSEEAKKYLHERGITEATIKEFRLGLAGAGWTECADYLRAKGFTDKEIIEAGVGKNAPDRSAIRAGGDRSVLDKFRNRIMFPIGDTAGRVVGFSGRIFGESASPDAPKYLNSPETPLFHKSRILYGFDRAKIPIRKLNCAVLVEGQMDLLASHQAGWGNTIAVSGTAFTPEHATLIRRMTDNLVLALDADQAGIKAAGRAARAALQAGLHVKVAQLPSELDPADLILKEGADAWKAAIRDSKDIITFLLDVLQEHAKSPDNFRRSVEVAVLPFLADVKSPIAREQYIREIALRLNVSESAVLDAFAKSPHASESPRIQNDDGGINSARPSSAQGYGRAQQAFALLIWQESIAQSAFDVASYARELENVLGSEEVALLRSLPQKELESMRFVAESLHKVSTNLKREADALLAVLSKERLAQRLRDASEALKRAEAVGDEKEAEKRMGECHLLTAEIAKLHDRVYYAETSSRN